MRVIVNADDLGMNSAVNSSIFDLMSKGRVTSATIMANGPAVAEALNQVSNCQNQSFGIHLNITEFRPLRHTKELAPLLDSNGAFAGNIDAVAFRPRLLRGIFEEFGRQITFLQSNGVVVSHIDSHQHVHTVPYLFPVIKLLQGKYDIRKVRITRTIPDKGGHYNRIMALKKASYNYFIRHILNTRTTDGFSSLPAFCEQAKRRNVDCRNFEIMVHPGSSRVDEELLSHQWEKDLPTSITLINYNQL